MRISFCTTVMDRLHHLKETLPANLASNSYPDLEFVILNYNSKDGVDNWICSFKEEIESGRLVYYKECSAKHFKPSHSRNVCALMATGDIVCNVDADNYTGKEFANHLAQVHEQHPNTVCHSKHRLNGTHRSTHGRLALPKRTFIDIGGYDEGFIYGWGGEDDDLFRRCVARGMSVHDLTDEYLEYIQHSEEERICNIDFSNLKYEEGNPRIKSASLHRAMTDENISKGKLVANRGKMWGTAVLLKNFRYAVSCGHKEPRIFI